MHIDDAGHESWSILNGSVHPGRKRGRVPRGTGADFDFGLMFGHFVGMVRQIEDLAPLKSAGLDVREVALALFAAVDTMEDDVIGIGNWGKGGPHMPPLGARLAAAPYPPPFSAAFGIAIT